MEVEWQEEGGHALPQLGGEGKTAFRQGGAPVLHGKAGSGGRVVMVLLQQTELSVPLLCCCSNKEGNAYRASLFCSFFSAGESPFMPSSPVKSCYGNNKMRWRGGKGKVKN